MDILKEFLDSSTIHGLSYISSAGVSFNVKFLHLTFIFSDEVGKDFMVSSCLLWVRRSWNPYCQVLQGVAGEPHRHLDHHPPHR